MQDTYSYLAFLGVAVFNLLIFPGGLFALGLGVLFKGLDRKIEARLQRRVGPPVIQPLIDIVNQHRSSVLSEWRFALHCCLFRGYRRDCLTWVICWFIFICCNYLP